MQNQASPCSPASLRALRCTHLLAGPPLRGVHRTATGLRLGAFSGGVRRPGASHRRRLEGAGPAAARRLGRSGGRRRGGTARGVVPCLGSTGRRSSPETGSSRCGTTGRGACQSLGSAGEPTPQPQRLLVSAAGKIAGRSTAKRGRRVRAERPDSAHGRTRRRRVHDRSDRELGCVRSSSRRCAAGRSRDVRSHDSHPLG